MAFTAALNVIGGLFADATIAQLSLQSGARDVSMNSATSLYLDLVRFSAAMVVLFSHASSQHLSGGMLWEVGGYGMEAVVVFFVLSGFVIGYAAEERERSARNYVINRMARIYSVVLPALVLTFALDAIGRSVDPVIYTNWYPYVPDHMISQALNSVFFTNEFWFNHVTPGMNRPYWSLGYEVPYYVAFGIAMFAPRAIALPGAAAVMVAAGPNVASLFPMWLLGHLSYRICAKRPLGRWAGVVLWSCSIVGLMVVLFPSRDRYPLFGDFSLERTQLNDRAHFYVVALLFALNIVAFHGASPLFGRPLQAISKPIRWMGQTTFALYLFHIPIMQFIVAVAPWPVTSMITRSLLFLGVPLIIFVMAAFTEQRKDLYRAFFGSLLSWVPKPKRVAS